MLARGPIGPNKGSKMAKDVVATVEDAPVEFGYAGEMVDFDTVAQ